MSANKTNSSKVNLTQLVTNIPVRRKLVDQDDRDKFEWNQWQSATKAINNHESPAKEKHIRNLILGSFRLEGSRLFWSMIIRINVESHSITCWKFCYAVHRLLRDGHKHVIPDSISLLSYFDQLRKYWSGLQQSYGQLTYRYCHLLISKLKFHERNPIFTGNLVINGNNNIENLFNNNLNSYFQLCIELFDYMEELLNLVQVIFTSLDQSRSNSMTIIGQCRLTPIIICIQDSSLLYDYIVKIIFKLHEGLSQETLQDHRQRLIDQFRKLKRFYGQSSTLQYFKNLIKVPILSENPPDFNLKEDRNNHQTPVAIVNNPSQTTDDLLIDFSDDTKTVSGDLLGNEPVYNRSSIFDLQQRLMQYDTMLKQNRSETDDLHRTIASKDAELITERNHRLQIEEQLRQQLENQKRLEDMHAIDNKTNSEEKFTKLREEHLAVLHREDEIKKQFLQLKEDYKKKENQFNENSDKFQNEIIQLQQTNDELQDRIQILTTERNDYQSITITTNQRVKQIEHVKQEHEENLIDLIHEREILEEKILDLEQTAREWAQKFVNITDKQKLIQANHENLINNIKQQYKYSILTYCINQMHDGIDRKNDSEILNSTECLLSKLQIAVINTKKVQDLWKKQNDSDETAALQFLNECIALANCMTDISVYGKTASNLIEDSRDITNYCIDLYTNYQTSSTSNDIDKQSNELIRRLNLFIEKTKTFLNNSRS